MNRGNRNGPVSQELAELNFHIQDEKKEIRGEGQGVSKEDDLQVNEGGQQRSEEQLQWPLGCWEGFQPHRSLKVLLVENDDSTRHVVTALLRKSGYLVTAVANGIHAWKILKDLTTHIDLVLTEVVMPCFSGIGLLSKIMGHKTCKNIPVIMMSSQDSMSMVFSCLSRGAVDFLVKPIRKNELRNLWQHVWRRCLSSSGSASESSIQTQKSTTSTSVEKADKNTDSNGEDDNGSVGLNARNPDDNGSSSEISQVIHLRPEAFCNDWVPAITTRECEGQDEELDAVVMGKDLKTAVPRIPNVQLEEPKEKQLTDIAGTNKDKHSEMNLMKGDEQLEKRQPELNNENQNGKFRNQAVDLMGVTTNSTTDPQMQCIMFDIPNGVYKVSDVRDKAIHDSKEIPFLELSLKTQKDIQDTRSNAHDPNVLRQSDLSAFSRYSLRTTSNPAPAGNVGSYSPLDKSSEASKEKSLQNFPSNSNSTPLYQHSDGFSNNNGMGSTTNNFLTKQRALEEKPEPRSTIKCLHPASAFQPEHNSLISLSQPIIQGKADTANGNTILAQGRGMNQQVQVQHHHHHYHHYHHVHNMPQHQQLPNHDDLSLKSLAAAAPQCGSSDVLGAPMEGNDGNHSLHGSGSGSNHSSSGTNGCSFAINSRGTNMDSDNGVVGKEGTILATGDGSRSGVDQNHLSQREAALNKFHQKRKERCFEKKVRYQSRKKLADERPRVRGQFVRQGMHENKDKDTHC